MGEDNTRANCECNYRVVANTGALSSVFVFSRAKQWVAITRIVPSRHPFGLLFFHHTAFKPQHGSVINSLHGRNIVMLCFIHFRHEIVVSGERDGRKELRMLGRAYAVHNAE